MLAAAEKVRAYLADTRGTLPPKDDGCQQTDHPVRPRGVAQNAEDTEDAERWRVMGQARKPGAAGWKHASGDFDRAAMLTLIEDDGESNDLALRAIARRGTKTVSGAARVAFMLAHRAKRERGELVSPVTCFKELLRGLLGQRMMH